MKRVVKKCKRIIPIFIVVIFVLTLNNISFGVDFSAAQDFISTGQTEGSLGNDVLGTIGDEFSAIGNMLVFIGAGILVAATGYMGILYMVSSPEKQAKLKQQLIGLVVSAIVIFGAYGIWSMVINLMESATNGG